MEVCKDIKGYAVLYQVSRLGRIKSLARNFKRKKGGIVFVDECIRKPGKTHDGYSIINLMKHGKSKSYRLHRIVAKHFIPNPENKPQINHIDGDKANNRVKNLEWVTQSENIRHAYSHGLIKIPKGNEHWASRSKKFNYRVLSNEIIEAIEKRLESGEFQKSIAKDYGVSQGLISQIKLKKTKYQRMRKTT